MSPTATREGIKYAALALLLLTIAVHTFALAIDTARGFELPQTNPPAEEAQQQ